MGNLNFHVHHDIEKLENLIPLAFLIRAEVYIMQEDRIVFYGTRLNAIAFMDKNDNKFCNSIV